MGKKRSELTCEDTGGAGVGDVCTIEENFYQIDHSMKKYSKRNDIYTFFVKNQVVSKDITNGEYIG